MSWTTIYTQINALIAADADTSVFKQRDHIKGPSASDSELRTGLVEVGPDPEGMTVEEQYQNAGCIRVRQHFVARFSRRSNSRAEALKLLSQMADAFKDALGKAGTNMGVSTVIRESIRFEPLRILEGQAGAEVETNFGTATAELKFSCKEYQDPDNR